VAGSNTTSVVLSRLVDPPPWGQPLLAPLSGQSRPVNVARQGSLGPCNRFRSNSDSKNETIDISLPRGALHGTPRGLTWIRFMIERCYWFQTIHFLCKFIRSRCRHIQSKLWFSGLQMDSSHSVSEAVRRTIIRWLSSSARKILRSDEASPFPWLCIGATGTYPTDAAFALAGCICDIYPWVWMARSRSHFLCPSNCCAYQIHHILALEQIMSILTWIKSQNTTFLMRKMSSYRVVPVHGNWHTENAGWNWAGFFTEGLETRLQRFGQFLDDL